MKKLLYIGSLSTLLLFGCTQNKEAELKEKIIPTLEAFVTSKLNEGMTLDSIIITKIDIVTPLITVRIEFGKVMAELKKQIKIYKLQGELAIKRAEQYKFCQSINPNDKTTLDIMYRDLMDEKEEGEKTKLLLDELNSRIVQLNNDINSNSIDSTTFVNYLVFAKIIMTNPDMTQKTQELLIQITKDFKIIKNE